MTAVQGENKEKKKKKTLSIDEAIEGGKKKEKKRKKEEGLSVRRGPETLSWHLDTRTDK